MHKPNLVSRVTRPVLPTETVITTVNVHTFGLLSLQVKNTDETQTLDCVVKSRCTKDDDFAESELTDLQGIQPGETRKVDIDVRVTYEIELVGTASGAGLDCTVSGLLLETNG